MSDLQNIVRRIEALRAAKLQPSSVGLSRNDWAIAKAEHIAARGLARGTPLTGNDVFGIAVTIHPGVGGNFIAYRGGLEEIK